MAVDLVIHNARIVNPRYITPPLWVAAKDGKIVALGTNESWPEAKRTIDATGKYVLPGVIDPEHHLSPPVEESFLTETRAAVAAGITTTGIMSPSPYITTRTPQFAITDLSETPVLRKEDVPTFMEVMPDFIDMGNRLSSNDYFLTADLTVDRQVKEIPELAEKYGVTSYKLYLHLKGGERYWHMWYPYAQRRGAYFFDDGLIFDIMRKISAIGYPGVLCIHPENYEIAKLLDAELRAQGRSDVGAYDDRSPYFTEAGHIRQYAYYARIANCSLYVVHTTNPDSIYEVKKAKEEGTKITAQTGVCYLTLDRNVWLVNVPLRSADNFEPLWKAIKIGLIEGIGSDHVSVARSVEELEETGGKYGEVWKEPWDTFPSRNEAMLPILLSEGVNKGRISLQRLSELVCESPAKTFGLYPKKGVITPGSDADFTVVDLDKTKVLTRDMIHSRCGWSIWEGWRIRGWPVMTILRGHVMMEWPEGEPQAKIVEKPIGQYIPRKPGQELYPLD
jgi:dihydropyrimidinase/dihydroorotase